MRSFDSHLTLQKLEVLCLVAELQSVTRAAEQLCVSQPVVTAHLRGLEEGLGTRLVRREGRGIAVRTGASDFAVLMLLPEQDLDGLDAQPLWDESLLLCAAPDSRWVGESADRETLRGLPFVSTYSMVMQQLEEGQVRANGLAPRRIVMQLAHPEAHKEAVRRDVGVCFFLQSSVHRDIARGELRWVQPPGMQMSIPLYLVVRKDKELSPFQQALRLYIEAARPMQVRPFERAGAGTGSGSARVAAA